MNPNIGSYGVMRTRKSERLAVRYKIERGIPIPTMRRHNGAEVKGYAGILRQMTRGDSVLLPVNTGQANALAARYLGQGNYATRRWGLGTRIWRTR